MFVVTKLDRLARSVRDAHEIVDDLGIREIKLNIGGSVHDPTAPMGELLFNVLAMIAEFEADLISMRTRQGMKVAKATGRLRGKQPKLTVKQEAHLLELTTPGNGPWPNWPDGSGLSGADDFGNSVQPASEIDNTLVATKLDRLTP